MKSILRLQCPDRKGIVAAVAGALSDNNCNIEEAAQFNDPCGQFFMRVIFSHETPDILESFPVVAESFSMDWNVTPEEEKVRTLLLASKSDHCLNDILYRWRTNQLPIEITGVISNHETNRSLVEHHNLPFHFLPVAAGNKREDEIARLIEATKSELVILARYMQVLSPEMCEKYAGRIINIHHSFLPGFKGAKPYHQAWERGVKIIGATAHFVTPELDDGPIIEQDVVRIGHEAGPEKMQILGADTEARVLSRAIALYAERRIFLHGNRTVIL